MPSAIAVVKLKIIFTVDIVHHRRTAVRPVLTAISQSKGNGLTSTPYRIQTP